MCYAGTRRLVLITSSLAIAALALFLYKRHLGTRQMHDFKTLRLLAHALAPWRASETCRTLAVMALVLNFSRQS